MLLVGATTCLTGMLHYSFSVQVHYRIENKVRELQESPSPVDAIQTREIKLQPPSNFTHQLIFLKVDQVNLSLYGSNISLPTSTLIVDYPSSKHFVVFTSLLYRSEDDKDVIMFLIGASQVAYQSHSIAGCGVDGTMGTSFKVRYVYEDIRQHRWQKFKKIPIHKYQQLIVECYGITIYREVHSFLLYHNKSTNILMRVYSNDVVVVPAPRVTPKSNSSITSVVCTKALSRGVPWLPEFLRYQKTLGVDHVHVAVLDTFIEDGGYRDILANDSFFLRGVKEGFISVQVWKKWYLNDEWFYYGNILMYLDCIYRYRRTYDFVSLLDTDDFLTIQVPDMSYKDFILKYCYLEGVGSCSFKWLFYYPGLCGMKAKVGEDGNVTANMVPHRARREQGGNFKPIHLSGAIRDSSFHDASCSECLVNGYRAIFIPEHIANVAHNRIWSQYKKEKVCH